MKKEFGFSLMELLTVMTILGIIASFGHLTLGKQRSERKLRQTIEDISMLIEEKARNATYQSFNQNLRFDTREACVWNVPEENRKSSIKEDLQKIFQLPSGIKISSARFGNIVFSNDTLTLRKNGTASPGTVTLKNKQNQLCSLTVTLYGAQHYDCFL